jgi:dipeptidyl aminopeptidase/acylaminoacyl peptidase
VPIAESDELVATARANGNPVEYLRFKDEDHGVRKRRNQIYLGRRVADFIERELIGDAPD